MPQMIFIYSMMGQLICHCWFSFILGWGSWYATVDFHLFYDGAVDMPLLIFIYSMMGQWIFIYSMMGQLTCKYELVWQEFSVESLILRWLLRPLGLLLNFVNVFLLFRNYLPLEMGVALHLKKTWIIFTKGCFVSSLVEIGCPVVLEKKMKMSKVYRQTHR